MSDKLATCRWLNSVYTFDILNFASLTHAQEFLAYVLIEYDSVGHHQNCGNKPRKCVCLCASYKKSIPLGTQILKTRGERGL